MRPENDVEVARRNQARFSVARKEKQFAPWIRFYETSDIDDALTRAAKTTAFEVAVLVETASGGSIYWTSKIPDLFNSTVLNQLAT